MWDDEGCGRELELEGTKKVGGMTSGGFCWLGQCGTLTKPANQTTETVGRSPSPLVRDWACVSDAKRHQG